MENVNIVLGTMTFGESVFHPDIRAFVDTFLDAGYEELDTAYVYNNGNCEKLLGEVLKDINKPYKIASKVNPRISGKLDGEAAYQQLSQSLERLGASCIDIFYLHFPDPMTPIESVLETCNTLWKKGKFRELGLSNFPAWMVADAWHKCDRRGWVKPTLILMEELERAGVTGLVGKVNMDRNGGPAQETTEESIRETIRWLEGCLQGGMASLRMHP